MHNEETKGISRQTLLAFLIGVIVGGALIGWFDANAKKPLFSKAGFCSVKYIRIGSSTSSAVGFGGEVGESGDAGSSLEPFVICENDDYQGRAQPEMLPEN